MDAMAMFGWVGAVCGSAVVVALTVGVVISVARSILHPSTRTRVIRKVGR